MGWVTYWEVHGAWVARADDIVQGRSGSLQNKPYGLRCVVTIRIIHRFGILDAQSNLNYRVQQTYSRMPICKLLVIGTTN